VTETLFNRVVPLVILVSDLTLARAQEIGFSGSLLTREIWSGPVNGFVSYTYDNDLDITSRRVNARAAIAFSYDADKLLTGVGALTITRNPARPSAASVSHGATTNSPSPRITALSLAQHRFIYSSLRATASAEPQRGLKRSAESSANIFTPTMRPIA